MAWVEVPPYGVLHIALCESGINTFPAFRRRGDLQRPNRAANAKGRRDELRPSCPSALARPSEPGQSSPSGQAHRQIALVRAAEQPGPFMYSCGNATRGLSTPRCGAHALPLSAVDFSIPASITAISSSICVIDLL